MFVFIYNHVITMRVINQISSLISCIYFYSFKMYEIISRSKILQRERGGETYYVHIPLSPRMKAITVFTNKASYGTL